MGKRRNLTNRVLAHFRIISTIISDCAENEQLDDYRDLLQRLHQDLTQRVAMSHPELFKKWYKMLTARNASDPRTAPEKPKRKARRKYVAW